LKFSHWCYCSCFICLLVCVVSVLSVSYFSAFSVLRKVIDDTRIKYHLIIKKKQEKKGVVPLSAEQLSECHAELPPPPSLGKVSQTREEPRLIFGLCVCFLFFLSVCARCFFFFLRSASSPLLLSTWVLRDTQRVCCVSPFLFLFFSVFGRIY
jgi:hypothetical protein